MDEKLVYEYNTKIEEIREKKFKESYDSVYKFLIQNILNPSGFFYRLTDKLLIQLNISDIPIDLNEKLKILINSELIDAEIDYFSFLLRKIRNIVSHSMKLDFFIFIDILKITNNVLTFLSEEDQHLFYDELGWFLSNLNLIEHTRKFKQKEMEFFTSVYDIITKDPTIKLDVKFIEVVKKCYKDINAKNFVKFEDWRKLNEEDSLVNEIILIGDQKAIFLGWNSDSVDVTFGKTPKKLTLSIKFKINKNYNVNFKVWSNKFGQDFLINKIIFITSGPLKNRKVIVRNYDNIKTYVEVDNKIMSVDRETYFEYTKDSVAPLVQHEISTTLLDWKKNNLISTLIGREIITENGERGTVEVADLFGMIIDVNGIKKKILADTIFNLIDTGLHIENSALELIENIGLPNPEVTIKSADQDEILPIPLDPYNLKWFRDNGYRNLAKNSLFLIDQGSYEGKKFIFMSWNGTVVKVKFANEIRTLRIKILVTLLKYNATMEDLLV